VPKGTSVKQWNFIDKVFKNEIIIRALPSLELIVALPVGYPSH
jgi:hypothetical protein